MDTKNRIWLFGGLALLAGGALLGSESAAIGLPRAPHDAYTRTELYFGTQRPDGGSAISEQEFQDFLDQRVTPMFPDGVTVQEGRGQYRDSAGVIQKERSYQVIVFYPRVMTAAADSRIESIRRQYDLAFQQESVGRVDEPVRASFS
ncbi:DUF3574 domain-containing protein [Kitasatospora sp. NBC_01287]|uniref:DUF3574 domain-containing protein n=1 Tax=Kitasatospora sp. NBC_01287 TaxID=2903573 RepID=UPI002251E5D5|nr:DUF3574 domain-containing protein [Kitasatospora sp. NBC_01287]MCX4744648.1 DUF3574 domain-containing protein [Kitasatospora sp. NBC_01287]